MNSLSRTMLFALCAVLAFAPSRLRAGGEKDGFAQTVFRLEPEIDCPACEDRIHDLLAKTRGVQMVEIDVIANRVVVRFDASKCSAGLLMGRVGATGYQAKQIK